MNSSCIKEHAKGGTLAESNDILDQTRYKTCPTAQASTRWPDYDHDSPFIIYHLPSTIYHLPSIIHYPAF